MLRTILSFGLIMGGLLGAPTAHADEDSQNPEYQPKVEALFGQFNNNSGVNIQVRSSGCTDKQSFAIRQRKVEGVRQIQFWRIQPDLCMAYLKFGKIITYSYEELGLVAGDKYEVINPRSPMYAMPAE